MAFRDLVVEAVKKPTLAAHSIFNRLQPRELKHIYDMQEMDGNYIEYVGNSEDYRQLHQGY